MFTTHSSFHPVRWAAVILVTVPVVLLAAALVASLTQQKEVAHAIRHLLRYTLVAESSLVLLLALWGIIYERANKARDLRLYPPPGKLIPMGGYRLHLYCTGEGSPTVVLEHGLDGSYLDWRLVQPEIARLTRVCSYDRAGYGWSDRSPKPRVPSAMVEELHMLLRNGGEKPPFIVVGHSMGAFDAVMYSHRYPDEVGAIVLVDGPYPDKPLGFPWREKLELRFMQLTSPFGLPRWRRWCAGGPDGLRAIRAAVNCKARVHGTHYEQLLNFPSAVAEMQSLENFLTLPLIVISRDPLVGRDSLKEQEWAERQKKLLQLSSNSTQVIADGSRHDVPGQRPDVIIDVVRRLVERMRQPAQGQIVRPH
jgi:pimeloyl-ACP methyl ester carboxylesterase